MNLLSCVIPIFHRQIPFVEAIYDLRTLFKISDKLPDMCVYQGVGFDYSTAPPELKYFASESKVAAASEPKAALE